MKGWRAAWFAAALAVLAYHFRLALPGNALISNDFRSLFIPLRAGLQNTLREGSWPFTAPADGLVVLLEPWFPGWRATLDGAPAPLLRADFLFMATPVRAGPHTLRLAYLPDRLLPGIAIAIVAAALLVLLCKLTMQRVDTRSPGSYFPPP